MDSRIPRTSDNERCPAAGPLPPAGGTGGRKGCRRGRSVSWHLARVKRLRLVQLPVPPPAALAATGNAPLAAGCLGVSARVHGLDRRLSVDVVSPERTDTLGDTLLADAIARDEPDFLGLSLYLWNTERSLHLAREVKRRSPRTQVLIGGPEVTHDNGFLLGQEGFDVAVTGEAEATFAALMERLVEGSDPAGLGGVAVRGPKGVSPFGGGASADFPLSRYPSPYVEGLVKVDPKRSTFVETVRGCRSRCTYCFYPRSSTRLRTLSVAESVRLVETLRDQGAREIAFLDPTFNHRPDFAPLLEGLARANASGSMSFFAEVRAEGLTARQAEELARAGFSKVELGLQSVRRETLERIKRGGEVGKVLEAAKRLGASGVDVLVDLIVGLPGDTVDDVKRGIDRLVEHGLGDMAQVFGLSVLPGTAMRATAAADGVVFDAAPPYRVVRTATMDEEALRDVLAWAEGYLDRRLDEVPRPHLVERWGDAPSPDTIWVDVDAPLLSAPPGAQHLALWFDGADLFARRDVIGKAIDARLALDPYATLDVVLAGRREFPLDLIDMVRARLEAGAPSYLSRMLASRGENLQRRIAVVAPRGAQLSRGWLEAASALVPVYRDQSAREALEAAEALGQTVPRARIVGDVEASEWAKLIELPLEVVSFADRALEARWLGGLD